MLDALAAHQARLPHRTMVRAGIAQRTVVATTKAVSHLTGEAPPAPAELVATDTTP